MKARLIGILAAAFFSSCGVGIDDPEGLAAAGGAPSAGQVQPLVHRPSTTQARAKIPVAGLVHNAQQTQATSNGSATVGLPVDPMPDKVGRTAPKPAGW